MVIPETLDHRARVDCNQRTHPHRSDNMIEFMAIAPIAHPSPEHRAIRYEE